MSTHNTEVSATEDK